MHTPIFTDTSILETIKQDCPKKKVISLCNQLLKRGSYKSAHDCEVLCHLAYWLYVYDRADLAMACIAPTHHIGYFTDAAVWGFLHAAWGLEIRILRARGDDASADTIAAAIDNHYLTPTPLIDTPEKKTAHEAKRRARFTYESVTRQDSIQPHVDAGNKTRANAWRLVALLGMIGNTETGLFPHLNERKADIEAKTAEYIAELKQVK